MDEQWQNRIATLEAERDKLTTFAAESVAMIEESQRIIDKLNALLHTRNGELLVARMELDMLRDDVKRAIALLPADPGAALGILVEAARSQGALQAAQGGPGATK